MQGRPRIIGVSDVSLGYGSPEVPAIFHELCIVAGERGLLFEPSEADRPQTQVGSPAFDVERLVSQFPSGTTAWRREFLWQVRKLVEAESPDVLVLFGGAVFSLLAIIKRRPRRVIYHAYEQIVDLAPDEQDAHRIYLGSVDLVISPEPHRLAHDCKFLGAWPKVVHFIFNSADVCAPAEIHSVSAGEREEAFFWSGALSRKATFAQYLWSPEFSKFRIGVYGRLSDHEPDLILREIRGRSNISYRGLVTADTLNRERARHAFSLVWWNPANSFGHLHLCSNRLFTGLSAGLPTICGPHPQCATIAKRFDVGLVAEDWSLRSISEAMNKAISILGTARYDKMVDNCMELTRSETGWDVQAAALRPKLEEAVRLS